MRRRAIHSTLFVCAFLTAFSAIDAQGNNPRRPALPAAADSNSWQSYYDLGTGLLGTDPGKAADAFQWAIRLEPTRPEPYYGRRVALLTQNPRRLLRYWRADKSTVRSREIQQIDSLYLQALTLNPFFNHQLDRFMLRTIIHEIAEDLSPGSGSTSGELSMMLDQSINSSPPSLRAWVAYTEGDFNDAERYYDQALRQARSRREKAALLTERGRLYFQRDKSDLALADLTQALDEMRRADSKDLIYLYESKALAEQSVGIVQNRLGNTTAAREAFARSLQEDLSYSPAHVQLAMLALDTKDTVTALSEMDLAVQIKPDDAGLRYLYGFTLSEVGRHADAQQQLQKSVEYDSVYAAPRHALAKVLEAQGKPQEALVNYRAFLSLAAQNDLRRTEAEAKVVALAGAK